MMGKYLSMLSASCEKSEISEERFIDSCNRCAPHHHKDDFVRFIRFFRTLQELEGRCPAHVPIAAWQTAVEDGKRFLAKWGAQVEELGWTEQDLFGLHPPPADPSWWYTRLNRLDATGLVWLLHGRPVRALTEHSAAIENPSGAVTVYYRAEER